MSGNHNQPASTSFMHAIPLVALLLTEPFSGSALVALTLTAAIAIPTVFFIGLVEEWRAAKTLKKSG
jgi:hypothetical protein